MCFSRGPSQAENQASAEERVEADIAKQEEVTRRAEQKREDISAALQARTIRGAMRGGSGRRSLFQAPTGAGFLSRFL